MLDEKSEDREGIARELTTRGILVLQRAEELTARGEALRFSETETISLKRLGTRIVKMQEEAKHTVVDALPLLCLSVRGTFEPGAAC